MSMSDLGAYVVKCKRADLQADGMDLLRRYAALLPRKMNESTLLGLWWFYFMAAEIVDARANMDARTFARFAKEIESAAAELGSKPGELLRTATAAAEASAHRQEKPQVWLARHCLEDFLTRETVRVGDTWLLELALARLEAPIWDLSMQFTRRTRYAQQIANKLRYDGAWRSTNPLLEAGEPCGSAMPGAIALIESKRDGGILTAITASGPQYLSPVAFSLGGGLWLRNSKHLVSRRCGGTPQHVGMQFWQFRDSALRAAVSERFAQVKGNWRDTSMYFRAIVHGNIELFLGEHPMPDTARPLPEPEFRQRWARIEAGLQLGDLFVSRDTTDRLSSLIAWADQGSWSHMMHYIGGGRIIDIDPEGTRELPLSVYADPKYRLALFRGAMHLVGRGWTREAKLDWQRKNDLLSLETTYRHSSAIRAGLSCILIAQPRLRRTPNGWIRTGTVTPLVVA
jgi:hypothetical protein